MRDHDLDTGLAQLARHGRHAGVLGRASDVRLRGDRRRRNYHVASAVLAAALLGTLSVGIASGQADRTRPVAPAGHTARPSTAASGPILAGERKVYIKLIQDPDGTLAVDAGDKVNIADVYGDRALFTVVPDARHHLIKAAGVIVGGEPSCLATRTGTSPVRIVATACDAADTAQHFDVESTGKTDVEARPTYTIANNGARLTWNRHGGGLNAQPAGADWEETTFSFLDQGRADAPPGD
jgi:hypothetical protein